MITYLLQRFAETACTDVKDADGKVDNLCIGLPTPKADGANLQTVAHIFVGVIAVVAVLIIVISALNIVTAGGDAAKVAKARSAILYALIGLVIAVIADVIVALVLGRLG